MILNLHSQDLHVKEKTKDENYKSNANLTQNRPQSYLNGLSCKKTLEKKDTKKKDTILFVLEKSI
jgi:hypothetical protein